MNGFHVCLAVSQLILRLSQYYLIMLMAFNEWDQSHSLNSWLLSFYCNTVDLDDMFLTHRMIVVMLYKRHTFIYRFIIKRHFKHLFDVGVVQRIEEM